MVREGIVRERICRGRSATARFVVCVLFLAFFSFSAATPLHAQPANRHGRSSLSGLTLSPTTLIGGESATGTVTLGEAAPSGGVSISVTSSNPAVTVPASVTIAAGKSSGTFTVATVGVAAAESVQVKATVSTSSLSAALTVEPAAIASFTLSPGSLVGGSSSAGTIVLSGPAPSSGLAVSLSSSNTAAATVPASFSIAGGATSGSFEITSSAVAASTAVSITAKLPSGTSMTAGLTVTPPPAAPVVATLSFSPATVVCGQTATGTVTLNGAAPAGGILVSLVSGNSAAFPVPASVTVAAGATSQTFAAASAAVSAATPVTVTATSGATSVTGTLTVTPALSLAPATLTFSGTLDTLSSSPESVTLTNNSSAGVAINSITASADFSQANNCAATLAAGASCTIAVTFTPPTAGSLTGTLTVASSAANGTLTAGLSGTGLHWIGLSWTDSDPTVVGYNVYRGTMSGGPYPTKLTSGGTVSTPSYMDSDPALVAGTIYYYVVTAVNSAGVESADSAQAQVTFP